MTRLLEFLLFEELDRRLQGLDAKLADLLALGVPDSSRSSEEIMRTRLPQMAAGLLKKKIDSAKAALQPANS